MQAALGVAQMEKLDEFVAAKRSLASRYEQALGDVPGLTLPREAEWADSTFWLYTILVDEASFGLSGRELMRRLGEAGIQSRPLWHPVHSLRPFSGCRSFRIETADELYRNALSLPSSVALDACEEDFDRVAGAIRSSTGICS